MGSARERAIDRKTDWQKVQTEIAKTLNQVKNVVNPNVKVPTLTQLSGGEVKGTGLYGNQSGFIKFSATTTTPSAPPISSQPASPPVKTPSRDVVNLVEPPIDAATIQNLLFENIGATELVKFTRHDTVDGINPYYNIISNLSDIKRKYDPSSLISLQKPESSYFDIYTIKLDSKIPDQTYLNQNNLSDYVYIDTNGDVVIELVNLAADEIIEVQIDTSGTIYRVDEL